MSTAILILCFTPLYRESPVDFCYLTNKYSIPGVETMQEHCDRRQRISPQYDLTVCREFDGSDHDKGLLR